MKTTKPTDEFELGTCLEGLGGFLIQTHTYLHDFCYFLTFKRTLKAMAKEFNDPYVKQVQDIDFFEDIDDPFVQHAYKMWCLVIEYLDQFLLRNGLNDTELVSYGDPNETERYAPIGIYRKYRSSYKRETEIYKYYVEQLSHSFYYYACALSVRTYLIPVKMRVSLDYTANGSFRLLNVEDYEVASLVALIESLQEKQLALEKLMVKKWW